MLDARLQLQLSLRWSLEARKDMTVRNGLMCWHKETVMGGLACFLFPMLTYLPPYLPTLAPSSHRTRTPPHGPKPRQSAPAALPSECGIRNTRVRCSHLTSHINFTTWTALLYVALGETLDGTWTQGRLTRASTSTYPCLQTPTRYFRCVLGATEYGYVSRSGQ